MRSAGRLPRRQFCRPCG